MSRLVKLLAIFALSFGLVSCRHTRDVNKVCNTDVCRDEAQRILRSIDTSVDPCTDFYAHACGNTIRDNPVPSDRNDYTVLGRAADKVKRQLREILEGVEFDSIPEMVKAKRMYQACLAAEESIEIIKEAVDKMGGAPLFSELPWNPDSFDIFANLAYLYHQGVNSIISVATTHDQKVPLTNVIMVDEGSLVADRDYFLEAGYAPSLAKYKGYIRNVTDAMQPNALAERDAMIDDMIEFQTKLANLTKSPLWRQNSTLMYNKVSVEDLQVMTDPEKQFVDWIEFLKTFSNLDDITGKEPVVVTEVDYVVKAIKLMMETDKRTIANLLMFSFIDSTSEEAVGILRDIKLAYQVALGGASVEPKRTEKCVAAVDNTFGYVIGRAFVQKYFSESAKNEAKEMIEALQEELIRRLQKVEFMDDATREVAIDKAKNINSLIGYPDWIMDDVALIDYFKLYPDMTKVHVVNIIEIHEVEANNELSKFREKIDTGRFFISPSTVNAIYVATLNTITIPAGILQSPLYQAGLPGANNFGGIGMIIGHEFTHGFDSEGRKYNKFGALEDWWPRSVVDQFVKQSNCFVDQYKSYCQADLLKEEPNVTICVNGGTTLGENIADNGGLAEAFYAWKDYIRQTGPDDQLPGMGNITSDQLFYLSFATAWCSSYTPIGYQTAILTDAHSPEQYRVIGALSNSPEFAKAFNCPVGPMNRGGDRCNIW